MHRDAARANSEIAGGAREFVLLNARWSEGNILLCPRAEVSARCVFLGHVRGQEWMCTWFPRYRGYSLISGVAAEYWPVINASPSMSTSHPPNAYTSSYHHQQPPASYQHQPYPAANHHLPAPVQIARTGSRDSASSDQLSPNRDGREPYANRERREAWDARLERKTRPATIAELADKSREDLWDPNKHLKHWLRTAELARKLGKQYAEGGDYERSFVQLARAATIILEKMPTHKDYQTLLTSSQRHNLVLVSLSLPFLVESYLALSFFYLQLLRGVHLYSRFPSLNNGSFQP